MSTKSLFSCNFFATDQDIETSLIFLRFEAKCAAGDVSKLSENQIQEDFKRVTNSSFFNQLALNLKGLQGLASLFKICIKKDYGLIPHHIQPISKSEDHNPENQLIVETYLISYKYFHTHCD